MIEEDFDKEDKINEINYKAGISISEFSEGKLDKKA